MPLRRIVLSDGTEITRNITDVRPDGGEFLPEKFTIPADNNNERGSRIYQMLAEIVENIAADHTPQDEPDAHGIS